MTKILMFASLMAVAGAFAATDYAVNVWITTAGANVTYSMGKGPASLDEVRAVVKKVATIAPEQTVHVIADGKTSMASLFALSKTVQEGGLTNIVVSVFCAAQPSTQSNGVERTVGMSLDVRDVHDFELQEIKSVQQSASPLPSAPAGPSEGAR